MDIVDRFKRFVFDRQLFKAGDRLLLTVSGGRDSMLMLRLFYEAGVSFEVAHCNFMLRGSESDADEDLVRAYAQELNVKFHVKHFDTEGYARSKKISIQMAARALRYQWFEELARERGCTSIAIAQHKNDHVETVLLNLARGTGLKGLRGILPKRKNIIRPLLFLDSKEITQAVEAMEVPYRDDMSNFSTKYARNKVRLDIVPQFQQLNPDFLDIMTDNIQHFQESYQVLQSFVDALRKDLFCADGDGFRIDKKALFIKDTALLYLLFEPFEFSKEVLIDFKNSIDKESGRIFESPTHTLLLDRDYVVLKKSGDEISELTMAALDTREVVWKDHKFMLEPSDDLGIVKNSAIAKLDMAKLIFPLQIRSWQEGDFFYPLGMKGKKKISDLFIQRKINVFEKQDIPIWINGNGDILWVAGLQIDDRYKITENTQKVLTLVLEK